MPALTQWSRLQRARCNRCNGALQPFNATVATQQMVSKLMVDFTGFVDSRNATELGGARRRLVHTRARKRMPACDKHARTHART